MSVIRAIAVQAAVAKVIGENNYDIRAVASLLSDDGKRCENYDEGESASPVENTHDIIVEIAVLIDSEPLAPDEIPFAVIDQDMLAVNALAACQVMGEIQAVDFSAQLDSDYGGDRR